MSTIHDALKKVQDDMTPQDSSLEHPQPQENPKPQNPFNVSPPPPEQPPAQEQEPEKPRNNKAKIIILSFILAIAALSAAAAIFKDRLKLPTQNFPKLITDKKSTPSQPQPAASRDGIHFKGIMTINKKNVAFINDAFYKIGDMVNDKKITFITKDSVTLVDESGQEQTLKTIK